MMTVIVCEAASAHLWATNKAALVSSQVYIEKQKGEILGVVIVESGWGSILPTVIIASLMHAGPAEKSGRLNIGDQIMTINGTSLVGLPLSTCQSIIKVPLLINSVLLLKLYLLTSSYSFVIMCFFTTV